MVGVAGGTYTTLSTKENVTIAPFCVDATEVTTAAFTSCVKAGKCTVEAAPKDRDDEYGKVIPTCNYGKPAKANHPINCVTYGEAVKYCTAQGKRLPTGAEWEWVARNGSAGFIHPWGDDKVKPGLGCWGQNERIMRKEIPEGGSTCAVGSFPAGDAPGGVHDLFGNVSEWTNETCSDCGPNHQPRGGGFLSVPNDYTITGENWSRPDAKTPQIGFRCVQ
jgi:formylglycine-generating enzyme required for sulfatase activity